MLPKANQRLLSKRTDAARKQMNTLGAAGSPFLFLIDFELESPRVWPLDTIDPQYLCYNFHGITNTKPAPVESMGSFFESFPIDFNAYRKGFDKVQFHLHRGDTFLLNLTYPTPIITNFSLLEIFNLAQAPYKLWWEDRLVFFSPETFVTIEEGRISSFPMKGTISALAPQAEADLLNNPKEKAEHATIVDLIRNDLSTVATAVKVERYRYVQQVTTHSGPLLQTSSHIEGQLAPDYQQHLGDILFTLLPAGSISGAPKPKTLEIITAAENGPRGYYTGICGIFDGHRLDSAVTIRYMEKGPKGLVFRSGGGITASSIALEEYQELIRKVYLPVDIGQRQTGASSFNAMFS